MSRPLWQRVHERFDPQQPAREQAWRAEREKSPAVEINRTLDLPFGVPRAMLTGTVGTGKTTELFGLAEKRRDQERRGAGAPGRERGLVEPAAADLRGAAAQGGAVVRRGDDRGVGAGHACEKAARNLGEEHPLYEHAARLMVSLLQHLTGAAPSPGGALLPASPAAPAEERSIDLLFQSPRSTLAQNPDAHLALVEALLKQGRYPEALLTARAAVTTFAKHPSSTVGKLREQIIELERRLGTAATANARDGNAAQRVD